jgi:hypothetical protein
MENRPNHDSELIKSFSYWAFDNPYRIGLNRCVEHRSLSGFDDTKWFEKVFNIKVSYEYHFSEQIFTLVFPDHETRLDWLLTWS